jgi:hypothetical protein
MPRTGQCARSLPATVECVYFPRIAAIIALALWRVNWVRGGRPMKRCESGDPTRCGLLQRVQLTGSAQGEQGAYAPAQDELIDQVDAIEHMGQCRVIDSIGVVIEDIVVDGAIAVEPLDFGGQFLVRFGGMVRQNVLLRLTALCSVRLVCRYLLSKIANYLAAALARVAGRNRRRTLPGMAIVPDARCHPAVTYKRRSWREGCAPCQAEQFIYQYSSVILGNMGPDFDKQAPCSGRLSHRQKREQVAGLL